MCVITVSGGWARGGQLFAEGLARRLRFRAIDSEHIIRSAAEAGAPEEDLRRALEKPPPLIDRLVTHKKYLYMAHLQAALAEAVKDGKTIYYGYAGHLLLSGAGPVLCIRIIADEELRLRTLEEDRGMAREEALAYVERVDLERKRWSHYLYGVDWEDPKLYDIVLNIGHILEISDACDVVTTLARNHRCFEMTSERHAELRDYALGCRVRARLAAEAPYANFHVSKISARRGTVRVESSLDEAEQITTIERIVKSVEGVRELDLKY